MSNYKAIEIPDSDEDSASEVDETMGSKRCETPLSSAGSKAKLSNEHTPKSTKVARTEPHSAGSADSTSPSSSDTKGTSPSTSADVTGKTGRNRARKSQQGARRISPDLQFESVALGAGEAGGSKAPKKPKLESDSSNSQDKVSTAIRNLVQSEEMQELIKQIANERVRCNFLLATYQLPDMNFALNTPMETLRIQFRERLKQRRDRGNPTSSTAAPAASASSQKGSGKRVVKAQKPQS
ncbi:uncharacterized protein LOC128254693 [Drosophila gunungcola]|uniref:Uncharacterized protein n=1 Tax=Drosophila gunungcola TaxID=103775 RepID=A0A9P9YK11_9MUSC|nr:uncharacterized protein LOC128254693 [Drosophila gunungcola]KAI8038382.1 hypothetical protein M5D96_008276 [Drosophila gunungcola]